MADGSGVAYTPGTMMTTSCEVYAMWQATAQVVVSYNNATVVALATDGAAVLETNGLVCTDDITITYQRPAAPTPSLQAKTNIAPSTAA